MSAAGCLVAGFLLLLLLLLPLQPIQLLYLHAHITPGSLV
jgi:hypothetical protein